jgi:hypothetical protein
VNAGEFGGPSVRMRLLRHDIVSFTLEGFWAGTYQKKVGFDGDNFTRIGAWGDRNFYFVNTPRASPGKCIFTTD